MRRWYFSMMSSRLGTLTAVQVTDGLLWDLEFESFLEGDGRMFIGGDDLNDGT
jgi:hypothetical protein